MSAAYEYVKLHELKQNVGAFNVFGIVTDVKPPRKTKGSGA